MATQSRKAPRKILAENLKMLMKRDKLSGAEVARRAKVDPKTVTNMLNEKHNPDLDHVASVASVFSLSPWQMIRTNLQAELKGNDSADELIENFYASNDEGRKSIMHVAEMAAKYTTK